MVKGAQTMVYPTQLIYVEYDNDNEALDIVNEKKLADDFYKSLNKNQLLVVDTIMKKVDNFDANSKNAFFIDGPGIFL